MGVVWYDSTISNLNRPKKPQTLQYTDNSPQLIIIIKPPSCPGHCHIQSSSDLLGKGFQLQISHPLIYNSFISCNLDAG